MQKLGLFWKIQDFCYQMGTEIFKIEEEMIEKLKHKLGNPSHTVLRRDARRAPKNCTILAIATWRQHMFFLIIAPVQYII